MLARALPATMAMAMATTTTPSSSSSSSVTGLMACPVKPRVEAASALFAKLARLTDALGSVPELSVSLASTERAAMANAARPSSSSSSSSTTAVVAEPLPSHADSRERLAAAAEPSTASDPAFARGVTAMITAMFQGREGPAAFAGKSVPAMGLESYVDRVVRYVDLWAVQHHGKCAGTGARCALMAVELLNRACDAGHAVCPRTAHRLFLAATLVSAKQTEDFVISNRFMGKVGGIPLDEMNRLELELCALLGWKLVVSRDDVAALREALAEPAF